MDASISSSESRKMQKLGQQGKSNSEEVEDIDRLSSLPNGILHHILSFLPTHCAVHTCLLSKSWKNIWTGVPVLDFDEDQMGDNNLYKDIKFIDFMEQAIGFHQRTVLDKFCLELAVPSDKAHAWARANDEEQIQALISKVLRRNIQNLIVDLCNIFFALPSSIYACTSLTTMELSYCTLKFPSSVCFPSLKYMKLKFVAISSEEVEHVSFSCPVLEECIFMDCRWYDIKVDVSVPKLGKMTLEDMENARDDDCMVNFYAESLVTLEICSCLTFDLTFHTLLSLYDASICIGEMTSVNSHRVDKLIQAVRNVKELTLSYPTLLKLSYLEDLLAFSELQNFIIPKSRFLYGDSLTELFCFLPPLESLIFMNGLGKYSPDGYDWSLEVIPHSFLLHLKSLEIRGFYGNETELSLVEFLLKNAVAIKMISIVSSPKLSADPEKQLEVSKRLLNFESGSTNGIIDFS